jgi:hypothetical protein
MHSQFESTKKRALNSLAQGETARAAVVSHAQAAQQAAVKHQEELQSQIPKLAEAATTESDPQKRDAAQRAYLGAAENIHRTANAIQLARRQQLQAGEALNPGVFSENQT